MLQGVAGCFICITILVPIQKKTKSFFDLVFFLSKPKGLVYHHANGVYIIKSVAFVYHHAGFNARVCDHGVSRVIIVLYQLIIIRFLNSEFEKCSWLTLTL